MHFSLPGTKPNQAITSPKRSSQDQSSPDLHMFPNESISNEKRQPVPLEFPPNEIIQSAKQIIQFSVASSTDRIEGPEFEVGQAKWQVTIHPQGNEKKEYISVFLKLVEAPEDRYSVPAAFVIEALEQAEGEPFHSMSAHYRFNEEASDWGFAYFLPHSSLSDSQALRMFIRITVTVVADPSGMRWSETCSFWNSYRETGFLGIRNQGATCYMNSLLQSLYFSNSFRALIFAIPTEGDRPGESLIISLQKLFCQLQLGGEAGIAFADTTDLTRSFGWGFMEAIEHHDVQEFSKKLQDSVERKLKEAKIADPFEQTFGGKLVSIIKCINVDYQSRNLETFHEILLSIQSGTMRASLEAYTELERIEGENGLTVEGFGKQDILKGVKFQSLPPVLHFQLLRFVFDFSREMTVKLNDRFEFPPSIDMRDFIDEPEEGVSYVYNLHGVLVHCGESNVGHYFAYLKPHPQGGWFKFDDEKVTPASEQEAIFDNYGQSPGPAADSAGLPLKESRSRFVKRFTNAYMLVCIRESEYPRVLIPISNDQIPSHVVAHDEAERRAERERREKKLEEMTTVKVKLADRFTVRQHEGLGFCSFSKEDNCTTLKLPRDKASTNMIVNRISEDSGTQADRIRLWEIVSNRSSKYTLSQVPVILSDSPLSLSSYSSSPNEKRYFVEYLYEESGPEDLDDIVAFVKVFSSDSMQSFLSVVACEKINPKVPLGSVLKDLKRTIQEVGDLSHLGVALESKSTLISDISLDSCLADYRECCPGVILILYQKNQPQTSGIFYSLGSLDAYFTHLTTKKAYTFINTQNEELSFRTEVSCLAPLSQVLGIISHYCKNLPIEYIRCFVRDDEEEIKQLPHTFTLANAIDSKIYFYTLPLDQFTPEEAAEIVNLSEQLVYVSSRGSCIALEGEYFLRGSEQLQASLTPAIYQSHPNKFPQSNLPLAYFLVDGSHSKISHWWIEGTVGEIQEALSLPIATGSKIYVQQVWGSIQVPAFHMTKMVANCHSFPFILCLEPDVKVGEILECLLDQFDQLTEREAKASRVVFEDREGKIWTLAHKDIDERAVAELWPLKWVGFDHTEPYRPQKSMKIL